MVKKYHMRNNSAKQTLSRSGHAKQQGVQQTTHQIQVAEGQRVKDNGVEVMCTRQVGDEHRFESTEVSLQKAAESRNELQKLSEDTFPEAPAEESSKQDGRDFNNRGVKRGRQSINIRSCQHTGQKAAQVASAPPGPPSRCEDEAEGRQKGSKVEQTMSGCEESW